MIISQHGGGCCGMSHIYGFPFYPVSPMPTIPEKTAEEIAQMRKQRLIGDNTYYFPRPKEAAEERFDAMIKEVKSQRPGGIIEVVLTNHQLERLPNDNNVIDCNCSDCVSKRKNPAKNWRAVLEEQGFKCVFQAKNSNSQNLLNVFHLDTNPTEK